MAGPRPQGWEACLLPSLAQSACNGVRTPPGARGLGCRWWVGHLKAGCGRGAAGWGLGSWSHGGGALTAVQNILIKTVSTWCVSR